MVIFRDFGNVCTIFRKNFFIPEKGFTFAIGGEDSEYIKSGFFLIKALIGG